MTHSPTSRAHAGLWSRRGGVPTDLWCRRARMCLVVTARSLERRVPLPPALPPPDRLQANATRSADERHHRPMDVAARPAAHHLPGSPIPARQGRRHVTSLDCSCIARVRNAHEAARASQRPVCPLNAHGYPRLASLAAHHRWTLPRRRPRN